MTDNKLKTNIKISKAKLNVFSFLFLYKFYFFIIRNLHSILSPGKSNLLIFLQNDFKKDIFHINISFPFLLLWINSSIWITLKAREPS